MLPPERRASDNKSTPHGRSRRSQSTYRSVPPTMFFAIGRSPREMYLLTQLHLFPGIKADAKLPVFEQPVHLRESGFKPGVIVVVHHAAPAAVVVIHQIGRVGQNE